MKAVFNAQMAADGVASERRRPSPPKAYRHRAPHRLYFKIVDRALVAALLDQQTGEAIGDLSASYVKDRGQRETRTYCFARSISLGSCWKGERS